jgi:hypothetical protein
MWTQDFFELLRESTLNESHFADAIAFKEQHLPKRIYKYRADTDYARENLKSGTIWLASPDSYNDPYDCLLRFSAPNMTSAFERGLIDTFVTGLELQISAEKIKEAKDSGTPVETLLKNVTGIGKTGANPEATAEHLSKIGHHFIEIAVNFLQMVRAILKICSFSEVGDSILMWSHYANQHQGFCIEYDLGKFDHGDAFLKNLYPVVYSNQLFDLTPWAEKLVSGEAAQLNTLFPLLGVVQKFQGWEYEKEWRYVQFQEKPSPDRARPMPLASKVLLGAKATPTTQKELLGICTEKNIPLWQMRMSNDKYELLAEPFHESPL